MIAAIYGDRDRLAELAGGGPNPIEPSTRLLSG